MRHSLLSISLLLLPLFPATVLAQVSISISVDTYPTLVQVPGYPVYYDPQLNSNYFFYDGLYWVYAGDTWYASSWYNGPWQVIGPQSVPLFVLRVPVTYYRAPPAYFRGWQGDAPPRWGEHWGQGWEAQHAGWDRWDRQAVPPPAPLPVYQRQYVGASYPRAPAQQQALRAENYHYQPREVVAQQQYRQAPNAAHSNAAARQQPAPQHPQAPAPQHAAVNPAPAPSQHPQTPSSPQGAEARPSAPAAQKAAPSLHQETAPPSAHPSPTVAAAPQQHDSKALPAPKASEEKKGEPHAQESK
ncbi:MAG: hypothetical protein ACLPJH_19545 [Myxococcaceae bacterium]